MPLEGRLNEIYKTVNRKIDESVWSKKKWQTEPDSIFGPHLKTTSDFGRHLGE